MEEILHHLRYIYPVNNGNLHINSSPGEVITGNSSDILEGPGPTAERKAAETSMRPMSLQEDMAANHDDDDDDDGDEEEEE